MEEKVIKIIADKLNKKVENITRETKLVQDLGADSLDVVELLMAFEEVYGITVPDEEAINFVTIGDVLDFLETVVNK